MKQRILGVVATGLLATALFAVGVAPTLASSTTTVHVSGLVTLAPGL